MRSGRSTEVNATAGRNAGIVARHTPDLFEDGAAFLGVWPNPFVLEGRLLARLLRGEAITSGDWLRDVQSMRLAAEVKQLRDLGWLVQSRLETVRTADRGRPARIARNWLDERQRKAVTASEHGRRFVAAVDATESRRPL